ncbi:sulfocyanin-like copper-binding protein [Cellulomonas sp. SG140]|uniref:sulfocyanin-like copper-binding protein n=1 Tax=Cellulomonas sp. SG140 TaxID=2976536 RepID=UPI0021E93A40|nr:sulfocyanin-like copper-binding protein [Cellulomonas sp. SG140]
MSAAEAGPRRRRRSWLLVALVTAVVLLIGSVAVTVAWAGNAGGGATTNRGWSSVGRGPGAGGMMSGRVGTAVPRLDGTTVRVTAVDMGAMMGGRGHMGLVVDRAAVPAGTVSLVLANAGWRTHELVVLPLVDGQQVGSRSVGADGTVDESGSVGEASRSAGSGTGDGIAPHTAGWTTLDLPAGRYELICNLPGHYAAGMYTELTVS